MGTLYFEWDERKNAVNLKKHEVDFRDAALIFDAAIVEAVDDRQDYGEVRHIAFGQSRLGVLRVVYTWRGEDTVRLISAWRAGSDDTERYYGAIRDERDQGTSDAW